MFNNTNTTDMNPNAQNQQVEFDVQQASREISKEKLSLDMSGIDNPGNSKYQTHRSHEEPSKETSHFNGGVSLYSAPGDTSQATAQHPRISLKFNPPKEYQSNLH